LILRKIVAIKARMRKPSKMDMGVGGYSSDMRGAIIARVRAKKLHIPIVVDTS
jgi:hypothetical protein